MKAVYGLAAIVFGNLVACTTVTEVNGKRVDNAQNIQRAANSERRAEIRLKLASTYYEQNSYNIALEELAHVLQADPDNAHAHGLRGLIFLDLGDRAQAEASFNRAMQLAPNDPELNNNYGWFLCRTNRQRESIQYFEKAAGTSLYLTPSLAHRNAGVCLTQLGEYGEAEKKLKRAFELDATDTLVRYYLTRLYIAMQQVEKARFYHDLLQKSAGESAETIWLNLRIARIANDARSERAYAQELRRRFPNSPQTKALDRGAYDE